MMEHVWAFIVGFVLCATVAYVWAKKTEKDEDYHAPQPHPDEHIG